MPEVATKWIAEYDQRILTLAMGEQLVLESIANGVHSPDDAEMSPYVQGIIDKLGATSIYHAIGIYVRELSHLKRLENRQRKQTVARIQMLTKTDFRCAYCGMDFLESEHTLSMLTVDHIKPKCRGGTNARANTVASCIACNTVKANANCETVMEGREAIAKHLQRFKVALDEARRVRDEIMQPEPEPEPELYQLDTSVLELAVA